MRYEIATLTTSDRKGYFLKYVYAFMALGMIITALSAFLFSLITPLVNYLSKSVFAVVMIAIVEVVLVGLISGCIKKLTRFQALLLFTLYSIVTGIMLSSIIVVYAHSTVLPLAFVSASIVFVLASLYGTITKRNIEGWKGWLFMLVLGLLLCTVVNMLLRSSILDAVISTSGVIIFTLLTAWDTKKMVSLNESYGDYLEKDELVKISLLGALELYLDFLNIFIYLLRIFERKSDRS